MSEVYIRSQNKEKLYRLGGNYACVEYGEYEDIKKKRGGAEADKKRHVICISDGCLEEIGEYATKERCLEVLDEIQKACVSYLFTAGGAAVIRGGMDVKVRNELTGGSCFLPCICWQEQADEAAQWQQGDTVELLGRYQSRQYEKVLDAATGEREQRTAYEVSVRLIRRKEEAENEC